MQKCPIEGCTGKHSLAHHKERIRLSKLPFCINGCNRRQVVISYGLCRVCYGKEHDYVKNGQLKQYGITVEEFKLMETAQNGMCAICGKMNNISRHGSRKDLCVDHDHETGRIRGLLCAHCNVALGNFRDSIENLENAIRYLRGK